MEFIFEILFELIFEGSLELGTSKKVPLPLRILAMAVFVIVVAGVLGILLVVALEVRKEHVIGGWLLILFDLFLLGCVIRLIWNRIQKNQKM